MKKADLHCDTISLLLTRQENLKNNSCHFDISRARQAEIAIQVFALFSKPDDSNQVLRQILKQMEKYFREIEDNRDSLYTILNFDDINSPVNYSKIGCLLHLEGAEALGSDIELLQIFYQLGLRSIGLTWNYRNRMADGVGEGAYAGGLTRLGRQLIKEINSLGMILDLAHAGEKSFYEALELYGKPLMVSHANARTLCSHFRNLSDDQLKTVQAYDGLVGVTGVSDFVRDDGIAAMEDLTDHIVYIADLIGTRHIALGSDFDGADHMVMSGIEDYRHLEDLLHQRGFSAIEIENILYYNFQRLLKVTL
ncbi:MAG: membrane dipeptidase [Syntrophomonadaceae bacterium]|jgi:membrane dipeptidase|nr:membrane dipeptidase [Syntrophomonadaceae bacterium]